MATAKSFLGGCFLGLLGMIGGLQAAELAKPSGEWADLRERTFTTVWTTVNEAYFDPTFGGVDWAKVGSIYRTRLMDVADKDQLRALLQEMVGELKRTHFSILPREAAVFAPAERTRIGTIGVSVTWDGHDLIFFQVAPGLAASRAGVRPGDVLTEVNGLALSGIRAAILRAGIDAERSGHYLSQVVGAQVRGAVGAEIHLRGFRDEGAPWEAGVKCEPHDGLWSEPMGNYPSLPVVCQTERGDEGIGYLRFNVFAPAIMKQVRTFLKTLRPGDGLIIDLRANPGGLGAMAPGIAGWLMETEGSLGTMKLRQGMMTLPFYPQEGAFLGPVAILIDGGSASTSEIMAAGLRDLGRVRLFGTRTAGAALPSAFKTLATGDLFQYAIADAQTPKAALIEGRGVEPDERVTLLRKDLAEGRDSVRQAAQDWLMRERRSIRERALQSPPGR